MAKQRTIGKFILQVENKYYKKQDWFTREVFTTDVQDDAYIFTYIEWAEHVRDTILKKDKIAFEIVEI